MRVASKPFNRNYTINTPEGEVVLNGEQVTKIEAKKPPFNPYHPDSKARIIVFHLSDGSYYTVDPSDWTEAFVKELFGGIE